MRSCDTDGNLGAFCLADVQVYGYIGPTGLVSSTNVPTNERVTAVRRKAQDHSGVADLELERAVIRAAQQHHVQPALLLAVMKAESSFNPTAVLKAGAVGLIQLIPETAIRHGVRNFYDANKNITGGATYLRYLLDRFHGNILLALASYNAGERMVDRYGQIPPYKETHDQVRPCPWSPRQVPPRIHCSFHPRILGWDGHRKEN